MRLEPGHVRSKSYPGTAVGPSHRPALMCSAGCRGGGPDCRRVLRLCPYSVRKEVTSTARMNMDGDCGRACASCLPSLPLSPAGGTGCTPRCCPAPSLLVCMEPGIVCTACIRAQTPAPPPSGCVTLDQPLDFSEPPFPHLESGHNTPYLAGPW